MHRIRIITLVTVILVIIPIFNGYAQSPDQLVKDGWALAQEMHFKEAIDLFEQALENDPSNPRILEALAKAYNWDRQYSVSISYYETLLELEPENVTAMVELADVYSTAAYYEQAVQWLTKAHELAPQRQDIADELATAGEWIDKIDNRIISLQRQLALDYNDIPGYVSLGRTYLWKGELEKAKKQVKDYSELATKTLKAIEERDKLLHPVTVK